MRLKFRMKILDFLFNLGLGEPEMYIFPVLVQKTVNITSLIKIT